MMGMSGGVTSCCVAVLLTLASVSAVKTLNSINDLKKLHFGQTVPKHTLLLLHWFASAVDVDNNDIIRLTFDPESQDYGSHHYGNYERVLDPLPRGYRYYTVGNLNQNSHGLPSYVVHPQAEYAGANRDRIIFRVQQNTGRQSRQVDQVYVTQHYDTSEGQGTRYDPEHTYLISSSLLRQIRQFYVGESLQELSNRFRSTADAYQLRHIRNTWGELAFLGLLLFIVLQEKHTTVPDNNRPRPPARRNPQPDFVVNIPENRYKKPVRQQRAVDNSFRDYSVHVQPEWNTIQLKVTTGQKGKARIDWGNIPHNILQKGAMVVLFNSDEEEVSSKYECIDRSWGSWETSVLLNDGLQARLHEVRIRCFFWKVVGLEVSRGPEFENPRADEAVQIRGYDAKIQLIVKDGKACARLYVKSVRDWLLDFDGSWIAFYTSANKNIHQYEWWQWQWATKFTRCTDVRHGSYEVYEYQSGMPIAPGVEARFVDWNKHVLARTPSWSR